MARYIEFYEVPESGGYEYYYMPVDSDAKNKVNFDNRSTRIWKVDKKSLRITTVLDRRRDNPPPLTKSDIMVMKLNSKPVPYDDVYVQLQKMKQYQEHLKDGKSSCIDQVSNT